MKMQHFANDRSTLSVAFDKRCQRCSYNISGLSFNNYCSISSM
jgi:hypothetical protein